VPAACTLIAVAVALGVAPGATARSAPDPASPPAPREQPPRVTRARLHVEGTSQPELTSALALRLPGVELVRHDEVVGPSVGLDVFVDVRRIVPERFAVTIVAADGRAFDRTVDVDAGAAEPDITRLLASHVGNLVAGIEAGTVVADRHDVPMPPAPVAPPPCPACPKPVASTEVAPPKPAPTPPPRVEVGLHARLGAILGLGAPTDTDRFAAWSGDLGVRLRSRQGVVALAEFRAAGREAAFEQRLVRMRAGVGIGYAWRGEHVEIETLALATVEPWTLRNAGARASFADDRRTRPLFGGALRFVPGWLAQPSPRVRVRVGPRLELAFSSTARDRGRVIQLVVDDGERLVPIGRIGGLELDLGLELVLWFDPRRR
jgi:hypothetical protein